MEKLNELVELAKKATPGEWVADWFDDERGYVTWYIDLERQRAAFFLADGGPELNGTGKPTDLDKADCNFIAAANPQTILAIADAFRALERRLEVAEQGEKTFEDGFCSVRRDRDEWKQRAEAAEAKLAGLERQEESRWNPHDGVARPIGLDKYDLVYLRTRRQELKLPYPVGMVNWKHDGSDFDVLAWASVNSPIRHVLTDIT